MSIFEAQRFLLDTCWGADSTVESIASVLKETDPSNPTLARVAQDLGYKVDERDIDELKNDSYLTRQADDAGDIKLNIGGQNWYVCQAFLIDESYRDEDPTYSSLLVTINRDGTLELCKSIVDDLCLGEGEGVYLICEEGGPVTEPVISLYSDTEQDPPLGGHDAHLKVTERLTILIGQDILKRVGLHPGDRVLIETSSSFDAYLYQHK